MVNTFFLWYGRVKEVIIYLLTNKATPWRPEIDGMRSAIKYRTKKTQKDIKKLQSTDF